MLLLLVLAGMRLPLQAESPSFGQNLSDSCDSKPIQVRGTVIDARRDEINPDVLAIILVHEGQSIVVTVDAKNHSDADCDALIGQRISVDGTCAPDPRGSRFSVMRSIHTTFDRIRRTEGIQRDPFDVPELGAGPSAGAEGGNPIGRRRVSGLVIATWYAKRALVRTSHGNLVCTVFSHERMPRIGMTIEATGIPAAFLPNRLQRCLWRPAANDAAFPEPPAERTTIRRLMEDEQGRTRYDPANHGKRLILTGRLRGAASPDGENDRILIENEGRFIPAYLRPEIARKLPIDCLLEITGTFIFDIGTWTPNRPFPEVSEVMISVAGPEDVRILEGPPWWTPAKFTTVCIALLTVLCCIILWNLTLNRIVTRKSHQLKREITARLASNLKTRERTRLAVELHDSIAQTLSGTAMEIGSALRCADNTSPAMLAHLRTASQTLRSCRDDLRDCLWDLRSNALEVSSMDEAILTTLRPILGDVKPVVRFNVLRKRLSDNTAHALLRIIHELVSNAIRHGHAKTIRIAGSLDVKRLLFSVRDDGSGFDKDRHPDATTGHFGLEGIRERIRRFNGTMDIDSKPVEGTKVTIALDVSLPEEEDLIET